MKERVQVYAGQLAYCYERVLKRDPLARARIAMAWTIEGSGVTDCP